MNIKKIYLFPKKLFFFNFVPYFKFSTTAPPPNYYEILELKSNCTQREVRKNYFRLAKIYHPDIYKGSDKDRFRQIKEAYDTLKIPEKREEYDKKINETKDTGFTNEKEFEGSFSQENENTAYNNNSNANIYKDWEQEAKKLNIDVEYQKFMGKDIHVKPEEVIISEDPLIKQFNEEEKKRIDFLNMRNNQEIYYLKYAHQQKFSETLDDTIKILNEQHKIKTEPEEKKIERDEKNAALLSKKLFWLQLIFFIVITPYAINLIAEKTFLRKKKNERIEYLSTIESKVDEGLLHRRMVFEGEDEG